MEILPKTIKYRKGYKYQLAETYSVYVKIKPEKNVLAEYVQLFTDGLLIIQKGYAWDGASGPTWDDKSNMRASLVHDALYQLMRLGLLPQDCKEPTDREMQKICKEDGMWRIRAWYYYQGVKYGGGKSCQPGYEPYPVLTAP